MTRQNRDLKAIDNAFQRSTLRSSLFRWMVKYHDEIVEAWNGQKIDWRTFCAEMAELGLTDTKGKPATERNARETWRQARKNVLASRTAPAAVVNPSKIDKVGGAATAPPPSTQPISKAPPSLSLEELKPRGNLSEDKEPYDPIKQLERLRRTIRQRSGRYD